MGHASPDTTLRYVRATQQDFPGEAEKIAGATAIAAASSPF
ncbi:hypothetical protein [Deinococcus marmoris]|uniref:Uncharacterized protein n=1 Tax=Deinococcus marmoris TaxID=249408 RepID=A0A1U7P1Y9_9DEIO|nr:hypothetical protein [Deinococcus marmoris]OLV19195.1 hypothetical protein BOO71_0003661 [Deinococcus marmoris]